MFPALESRLCHLAKPYPDDVRLVTRIGVPGPVVPCAAWLEGTADLPEPGRTRDPDPGPSPESSLARGTDKTGV